MSGVVAVVEARVVSCLAFLAVLLLAGGAAAAAERVVVNDVALTKDAILALEQKHRIKVLDGDYWYDKVSGAWGYRGGPAIGQILPFLNLGGPLKANASSGNTNVFINGRELHILDVRALQQITIVIPGRYWCDAYGNMGFEGGPALTNLYLLADAARSNGVRREGILSTYDKTGAAVIGGR